MPNRFSEYPQDEVVLYDCAVCQTLWEGAKGTVVCVTECPECLKTICPACPQFECDGCGNSFCEDHKHIHDGLALCLCCLVDIEDIVRIVEKKKVA